MYIPLKRRAYKHLLDIMLKYEVEPNYGWKSVDNISKLENQLIICNTTVILLLQTREKTIRITNKL